MACLPLAMKRERRFLAMPANVRLAEGSHLKLILKKGDGEALAELVRRIKSCRWSLARQNRSHEQRHDDATSRCYSGKHENCEIRRKNRTSAISTLKEDIGYLPQRGAWLASPSRCRTHGLLENDMIKCLGGILDFGLITSDFV